MTISTRLYLGFGALVGIGAVVAGHGAWQLSQVEGQVGKLNAISVGMLSASPGTAIDLQIAGFDRTLRARFIETSGGGINLQLPLNHEHLTYMTQILSRLGIAAAA